MGSCHSSGLLLSNIFIFLSEFWVQLGQQLVSADIEQATKASKTQVALTSFSFVHHRAPTFGILLQSAMFQIRQQGIKTIKGICRPLASTKASIGPGKRQSRVCTGRVWQREQVTEPHVEAGLPGASGTASATNQLPSYRAKRWAGWGFFTVL